MTDVREDTLIFAPSYNESGTIEALADALLALPLKSDLLFVDDSSTDGTTGYLLSLAAAEPRVRVIVRPAKLGVGSAHKLAWLYARMQGYSRIATLDADLSHDPLDVPRILATLDAGADFAIGSRFCPGGRTDYQGWRRLLSGGGNRLARLVLRLPITEYTTALRAARLDRVPPGLVESVNANGYSFFMTCIVYLARLGLAVTEVPIHFRDRRRGSSKMPQEAVFQAMLNLLRLAADRRRIAPPGIPSGLDRQCPACGSPYRAYVNPRLAREESLDERRSPQEFLCLKCFGRGSTAR
jgi:dolichol-phosphate mannosyltransferase